MIMMETEAKKSLLLVRKTMSLLKPPFLTQIQHYDVRLWKYRLICMPQKNPIQKQIQPGANCLTTQRNLFHLRTRGLVSFGRRGKKRSIYQGRPTRQSSDIAVVSLCLPPRFLTTTTRSRGAGQTERDVERGEERERETA